MGTIALTDEERREIEQRIAYAEATTLGKTIFEYAPNSAAVGGRFAPISS